MWVDFKKKGYILSEISGYKFFEEKLENMNPQKLFNYKLQLMETEVNTLILWDILRLLRGKKTQLVLYVYDSYLFDLSQSEEGLIEEIEGVFEKYKLNIKKVSGKNYGEMT